MRLDCCFLIKLNALPMKALRNAALKGKPNVFVCDSIVRTSMHARHILTFITWPPAHPPLITFLQQVLLDVGLIAFSQTWADVVAKAAQGFAPVIYRKRAFVIHVS